MSWRWRATGTVREPRIRVTEFLKSNELAKLTNVSRRTVDRWVKDGIPCTVRRSGVVRISLEEALEWLRDGPGVKQPPKKKKMGRRRNVDRGLAA
jgi:hypothetical protein